MFVGRALVRALETNKGKRFETNFYLKRLRFLCSVFCSSNGRHYIRLAGMPQGFSLNFHMFFRGLCASIGRPGVIVRKPRGRLRANANSGKIELMVRIPLALDRLALDIAMLQMIAGPDR
ncbi:MAG: hypothetical protein KJZ57_02220 [Anaerolineales bacterium]|nr:hypothetical protein [Anaerolineales bacterium]